MATNWTAVFIVEAKAVWAVTAIEVRVVLAADEDADLRRDFGIFIEICCRFQIGIRVKAET